MAQNLAESSVAEQHMVSNLAENWWALVIRGVAGVVFGIAALVWPPGAVAALVLLFGPYALVDGIFNGIGAYALAFGALLIALGLGRRTWGGSHRGGLPGAAVPRPA